MGPASYAHLTQDIHRNNIYMSMLEDVYQKECVEVGFGSGILSLLALQQRPKHIIAFERQKEIFDLTDQLLRESKLNSAITLINKDASPYDVDLTGADIMYHELLGDNFWEPDAGIDQQLFRPFLSCKCKLIPGKFTQNFYVAPLMYKDVYEFDPQAVSMQYHGLTKSYVKDCLFKETVQVFEPQIEMKVLNRCRYKREVEHYIKLYNEVATEPQEWHGVNGSTLMKKLLPNAKLLASITTDKKHVIQGVATPPVILPLDHDEPIELVIDKKHLPDNYVIFTANTAGSGKHTLKLYNCTSWNKTMHHNFNSFISSPTNPLSDLHIKVDTFTTYATL